MLAVSKGVALDLGCGPGYRAAALCDLGCQSVIALDTSQALLDELKSVTGSRSIDAQLADLREFKSIVGAEGADAIVCMGDTLTHLDDRADVSKLLHDAYHTLRPNGRLALTFRDFSVELTGADRFIPVRADDRRIMLCALLYEPEHVVVNDLVYLRSNNGWHLRKSSYRKIRLVPSSISSELRTIGFSVEIDVTIDRMQAIVARKR
nr:MULTISPECIES: methyltransferase domain-containing protein [Methylorubrum]